MDLEATVDETDVVVIDMGSGVSKIGFCGEDAPRASIPTIIGILQGLGEGIEGSSGASGGGGPGGHHNSTVSALPVGGQSTVSAVSGPGAGDGGGPSSGSGGPGGGGGKDSSKSDGSGLEGGGGGAGSGKRRVLIGEKAVETITDPTCLHYPCVRGSLDLPKLSSNAAANNASLSSQQTPEAVEQLYHYFFRNVLNVEPEEIPVLILDSPTTPSSTREWLCELLFEKFKVKSLGLFNTAIMSLFSTGKTRGLVLECGDAVSHAVPIFEGYAIPHAIFRADIGGRDLTERLYDVCVTGLGNEKHVVPGVEALLGHEPVKRGLVMRSMKEKVGEVVENYQYSCIEEDKSDLENRSFELPDGSIVQIPSAVRYAPGEILFDAKQSVDPNKKTLQSICWSALQTVDADFRTELMKEVVVAGGTSMMPGLPQRLEYELSRSLGLNPNASGGPGSGPVNVHVDSQRKNASWIGGSMFASFSTFHHYIITRDDYEDGKVDLRALSQTQLGVSEMFASHEEDFHESEGEIRKLLATASGTMGPGGVATLDVRLKSVYECEKRIRNAEQSVTQMEMELRTVPNSGNLATRVRQYKTIVAGFKREFVDLQQRVERDALMVTNNQHGKNADPNLAARIQRVRIEETSGKIGEGNRILAAAQTMANDTMGTGMNIMTDLRGQREVIQESRGHMQQIDRNLTQSRRVILQMSRRVLANKIILMSTALVLSITLLLLLFIKLSGKAR